MEELSGCNLFGQLCWFFLIRPHPPEEKSSACLNRRQSPHWQSSSDRYYHEPGGLPGSSQGPGCRGQSELGPCQPTPAPTPFSHPAEATVTSLLTFPELPEKAKEQSACSPLGSMGNHSPVPFAHAMSPRASQGWWLHSGLCTHRKDIRTCLASHNS